MSIPKEKMERKEPKYGKGIYKRGKYFYIKYSAHGHQVMENTKSTKPYEAKIFRKKRLAEATLGNAPNLGVRKTRFSELVDDVKREYEWKDRKTKDTTLKIITNRLSEYFGNCRVIDITTDAVEKYMAKRRIDGVQNPTIKRELEILKHMFNLALHRTPPKVTCVPFMPHIADNPARRGFFEHEEYLGVRGNLPARLRGGTTLAFYTGMRPGEIFNLKRDRLDLMEGKINLQPLDTKNNEPRVVYLNPELLMFINLEIQTKPNSEFVFSNDDGTRIVDFRKSWKSACKKAGVQKYFYDFRRTAIRNMVRAGVPERVAMLISGHKTRSIFERYNIVNEADQKKAQEKVYEAVMAREKEILEKSSSKRVATEELTLKTN
jgi:integrase